MATSVTYAGNSYSIPAYNDTGYAQGPGNLSAYLIALATGNLTVSGGTVTLLADANFGANFGLVSIYYKSRTANISTAGVLRLANTDTIGWRNFANGGNLLLAVNASDQLTFNGTVIGLVGGSVTSVTGTSNQINSTGGTTPVLSLSSTLIIPGTFTIPATTNQIILGTTNTVTITSPAPAASRVYTILDVLAAANFVMSAGAQTLTGNFTFSGASTVSMAGTINMNNNVAFAGNNQTAVGSIAFNNTATGGITGTVTNDSAAAGRVGEYISSSVGASNFAATTVYDDLTSISLTAGDWDVSCQISQTINAATVTGVRCGVSASSGSAFADEGPGHSASQLAFATAGTALVFGVFAVRFSLAGTTTVYLKRRADYTGGPPQASGMIWARRRR